MATNTGTRLVEVGIDSKELDVIVRALISYERELENTEETCKALIQRAIDRGKAKTVDTLGRLMHRAFVERLNAEAIRFEMEGPEVGTEVARIVLIDRDQTKIVDRFG